MFGENSPKKTVIQFVCNQTSDLLLILAVVSHFLITLIDQKKTDKPIPSSMPKPPSLTTHSLPRPKPDSRSSHERFVEGIDLSKQFMTTLLGKTLDEKLNPARENLGWCKYKVRPWSYGAPINSLINTCQPLGPPGQKPLNF